MMNNKLLTFLGLLILGLTSCTSGDGNDHKTRDVPPDKVDQAGAVEPAEDIEIVRGHYVFGHEVRSLRPCGENEALWVVDRTNLIKDLHGELAPGTVPYSEVFVAVAGRIGPPPDEGFGAEYPGALTVEEVIYVAFEGFGCDFDWSRFLYRAQGNEPFWALEVLATGMRLTRPGQPGMTWTEVSEIRREGAVIFRGAGGGLPPVKLVIEADPSRDTMSGAYYGLSARLVLDGQTFTGHALRGAGTERP